MCGIAGFAAPRGASIDRAALVRMLDRLRHRGPDGDGIWISPEGNVGFGHRRLAIIDLTPAAAQPMTESSQQIWVTFNGEIYNHQDLRRELEALGHTFRTDHADTEVLVQGYLAWGFDGLLLKLNGIFAFALHDRRSGETWLARDHVGVKPLYFNFYHDGVAFASEIKALLTLPGVRNEVNVAAAHHYLTFMVAPAPMTMIQGVYKLPAGWRMRIAASGKADGTRYFSPWPDNTLDALPETERVARVREVLRASVERQLLADVPVGLFLSGGVDSTALLALASEIKSEPPRTFSVGFVEPTELDEAAYAATIADRFGSRHTEVRIGARDVALSLDEMVFEQDEPIADWVCLPLRAVARSAHEAGIKTVLCGEGADEQFCGYEHYLRYLDIAAGPHKWISALHTLGAGRPIAALADFIGGQDLRRSFHADFLRRAALGQEAFWGGAIVFTDGMKRSIWRGGLPAQSIDPRLGAAGFDIIPWDEPSSAVVSALLAPLDAAEPNAEPLQRMIWLELAQRLPELLLMRVDKMCMASSLEARVPFLDLEIVRMAAQFGRESKIPGRRPKHLLKQALRGIVPDDVLDRRKKGFGAPMCDWLRGDLGIELRRRMADSTVYQTLPLDREACLRLIDLHYAGERDYSIYIWALFNLAAWHDRWCAA